MTPGQAAWVEQHVVTDYHLANDGQWWCGPQQDADPACLCQMPCWTCQAGRHTECRTRQTNPERGLLDRPRPETHLRAPAAWRPAAKRRPLYLAVWLADRACRPRCRCTTCTPSVRPAGPPTGPGEQLHLFAEVA
ncbi:hypothetical protein ACFWPV_10100 [Streptomyces uncialis]|uniref:hypothetical protein n=1 Tax=Streptomyces uncialis TaxID=1048205 RepID=UPI003648A111